MSLQAVQGFQAGHPPSLVPAVLREPFALTPAPTDGAQPLGNSCNAGALAPLVYTVAGSLATSTANASRMAPAPDNVSRSMLPRAAALPVTGCDSPWLV